MNIRTLVHLTAILALTAIGAAQTPVYPPAAKVRADFARLLERPQVALAPQFAATVEGGLAIERGTFATEAGKNCPLPGAKLAFAEAEAAYKNAGAADKLTIDVAPNARHLVVPAHRQLAHDWLDRQLRPTRPVTSAAR